MNVHTVKKNIQRRVFYILGALLLLTSGLNAFARVLRGPIIPTKRGPSLKDYSFVGDDYPAYYPTLLPLVSLTPENTIHYEVYTIDAKREWDSIYPEGGGFVWLGPQKRPFGLALFHEMHCFTRIRHAMATRETNTHVHHCLNYLRQMILCEANPTLEPVIPIIGRRSVNAEVPRVCKDWTKVYQLSEDSYHNFLNNITTH